MKLQDRLGISDEMIEAIRSVTEKKATDPVSSDELKGKYKEREDKDIDNDGDTDKSDKFLHKKLMWNQIWMTISVKLLHMQIMLAYIRIQLRKIRITLVKSVRTSRGA